MQINVDQMQKGKTVATSVLFNNIMICIKWRRFA